MPIPKISLHHVLEDYSGNDKIIEEVLVNVETGSEQQRARGKADHHETLQDEVRDLKCIDADDARECDERVIPATSSRSRRESTGSKSALHRSRMAQSSVSSSRCHMLSYLWTQFRTFRLLLHDARPFMGKSHSSSRPNLCWEHSHVGLAKLRSG